MNLLARIQIIPVTDAKAKAFARVHPAIAKRNKSLLRDMEAFIVAKLATVEAAAIAKRGGLN